jgi:cellulose synthase/poly-beta-1,6-N-acetylglucosamine synthase-like glycosyltransferase
MLISGGFGIFDREAVLRVGGYDTDSLGEDLELTVKLHRYHREKNIPYRIQFQPEPVCWTNVPADWDTLSSQRNRWHRGLMGTLIKHKKMIFNKKYGVAGLLAMPYYLLVEFLGPFIEMFGYVLITVLLFSGNLNETFALLFFIVAVLFGMILSVAALITDEYTYSQYPEVKDMATLNMYGLIENLGYRQLHTWWRIHGVIDYMRGKTTWGDSGKEWIGPKINNALHWIWFVVINGIIGTLGWYGIKGIW